MSRDLKEDIWGIWKILTNCKENFLYSWYLHKPDTNEEVEYLLNSRHLIFLRHSLWRLCVIELHKLLTKSDKDFYNLWTLIKNLENNVYETHNVPINITADWKKSLNSKKVSIKKILLLRNKIYAHTDPEIDKLAVEITFDEVQDLILVVESVIKGIYKNSFDSQAIIDTPIFERENFDMIKILAKEKSQRIEALKNWRKPA